MKIVLIFIGAFLMAFSCKESYKEEIAQITFSSGGMSGHFETISITSDSITITYEQRRTAEKEKTYRNTIGDGSWQLLQEAVPEMTLSEISELESPTMARAYDGAMHSEIVIRTKSGTQYQHAFDDQKPHQELQPLMTAIRELADAAKKHEKE